MWILILVAFVSVIIGVLCCLGLRLRQHIVLRVLIGVCFFLAAFIVGAVISASVFWWWTGTSGDPQVALGITIVGVYAGLGGGIVVGSVATALAVLLIRPGRVE
jgi:hypothetical protein